MSKFQLTLVALLLLSFSWMLPVQASEVGGTISTGIPEGSTAAEPTASPVAGSYTSARSVTLTAAGASSIRYTTNGTTPSCSVGTIYSGAISVSSATTIKAVACYSGVPSNVASFSYTFSCTTVSHGSVSSYPSCTITCASGYHLSGSSCVAGSSHGGGGGGGSSSGQSGGGSASTSSNSSAATIQSLLAQLRAVVDQYHATGHFFDAATEANIASLLGMQASSGTGGTVRDLTVGMSGTDVTALQTLLIAQGYVIPAGATGFFAGQTHDALAKYQAAHGIAPAVGYFGVTTRTQMKSANLTGLWW